MALLHAFARRLYLRIWLAVVASVAVLSLLVGWAWRVAAEHNTQPPTPREVVVRNAAGEQIGSAQSLGPHQPGQPLRFQVTLQSGDTLQLEMPPRPRRLIDGPPPPGGRPPPWARPPYGFLWMLGLVALAVALGVYPIVRRLTERLESLQRSVQRWGEGELSVRIPTQGQDEVADLARRFNAAAERIESLLSAQKSLLANASHELRSPLARIRMAVELMDGHPPASARQEISRSIGELDQLIDEILLASRLDAQEVDLGTVEPVDLVGLAAEEAARLDAELQLGPGTAAIEVNGVAKLLRRMVRNLLENARRHGARAGAAQDISLGLETRGGEAWLQVCDRGPGVPAEQRERIFEPFYRLPGASEREGGVGLGLALVKSIAQRHGGSVRCEDRPGGGACFTVRLPLRPGA